MPRTAPTVDGAPTLKKLSIRWQDFSGDQRSDSIDIDAAITNVEIEALVAAVGAISNAELYAVNVTEVYQVVPDSANATNAPSDSVYDNIVVQGKNATNISKRGFIPAPTKGTIMVGGTDQIDPTSVPLATYLTALLAILGAGYNIVGARYTERREINEQVRF